MVTKGFWSIDTGAFSGMECSKRSEANTIAKHSFSICVVALSLGECSRNVSRSDLMTASTPTSEQSNSIVTSLLTSKNEELVLELSAF
jgi:hypothetical protein